MPSFFLEIFMKLIISFLLCSLAYSSNFNGIWTGSGAAKSGDVKVPCHEVEMRLLVSADKFILRGGHYNCDGFSAEYPYFQFSIQDGELYDNGRLVGSISNSLINIFSKDEGFNLDLQLNNGELYMNESWVDGNEYFRVIAKLKNK